MIGALFIGGLLATIVLALWLSRTGPKPTPIAPAVTTPSVGHTHSVTTSSGSTLHSGMTIPQWTRAVQDTFVLKDIVDTIDKMSAVPLRFSSSKHMFTFWEGRTVIEVPTEHSLPLAIKGFAEKVEDMAQTAYDLGYRGVVFVDDTKIAFGFENAKIAMVMKLQFGGAV